MSEIKNLTETKVGKIVANDFRAARVLGKYGIDFCCRGGTTLTDACLMQGVDAKMVAEELSSLPTESGEFSFSEMSPDELIDYIELNHHAYIEKAIPFLKSYLAKLCQVHGERHPELIDIRAEFEEAADALTMHMKKEELILFPYIKAMNRALTDGFELSAPHFGHVINPITMMQHEHETEGDRFRRMEALTQNYTPPADGCQTYRVAFAMLQEFQDDLHIHIHLENNILFPAAEDMNNKMQGAPSIV